MLLPLQPGDSRRLRNLPGKIVDGEPQPDGDITIRYQDAIGNQLKTECATTARVGQPMYGTSLRMADGNYELLKTH